MVQTPPGLLWDTVSGGLRLRSEGKKRRQLLRGAGSGPCRDPSDGCRFYYCRAQISFSSAERLTASGEDMRTMVFIAVSCAARRAADRRSLPRRTSKSGGSPSRLALPKTAPGHRGRFGLVASVLRSGSLPGINEVRNAFLWSIDKTRVLPYKKRPRASEVNSAKETTAGYNRGDLGAEALQADDGQGGNGWKERPKISKKKTFAA